MKKDLNVDSIRLDGGTQSRIKTNEETVDDYAATLAESNGDWPFKPLDIYFDGTDHMPGDGFHRLLAAIRVKRETVPCNVHKGTATDARIFGMKANNKHGLRPSRADKRANVIWLLEDNGGKMTQKAIAEAAGVTVRTVKSIIAERNPQSIAGKAAPPKREYKGTLSPSTPIRGDSDPFGEDVDPFDEVEEQYYGEDEYAEEGPPETTRREGSAVKAPTNGKPPKQYDRSAWLKRWEQSIGPLVRLVDAIAKGVGESKCKSHKAVQGHLKDATNEVMEWMGNVR